MSRKKADHFPKSKRKPWYEELKKPVKVAEYLPQIGDVYEIDLGYEYFYKQNSSYNSSTGITTVSDVTTERVHRGFERRIIVSEYKTIVDKTTWFSFEVSGYNYIEEHTGRKYHSPIKGRKVGENKLLRILYSE